MNKVGIQRIHEQKKGETSLFTEMDRMAQAIRRRAFDHFLGRGGLSGGDLDDWLRAERELIWTPGAEMTEDEKDIHLRVQAPGLEPDHITITATPGSLLIQAEMSHRHEAAGGKVCFSDFSGRLFRRIDLPSAIDVDHVSATLDKGILRIDARKRQTAAAGRTAPGAARETVAA